MVYLFLSQKSFKPEPGSKPSFAVRYQGQDRLQPVSHLLVLDTREMRVFSRGSYVYDSPAGALNKKMLRREHGTLLFLSVLNSLMLSFPVQ